MDKISQELFQYFLADLSPQKEPIIYAVGGSPGSGKTTFRKQHLRKEHVLIHDMDEVLVRLPGYQQDLTSLGSMLAFEKWWPIARKLADAMVQIAIGSKYSIVYDRTCGAERSYLDFVHAKEQGYRIRLTGLWVDKTTARKRIKRREREENRALSQKILDEYRARFSALWPSYLSLVGQPCPLGQGNDLSGRGLDPSHPNFEKTPSLREGSPNASPRREDEAVLYDTTDEKLKLIFSSHEGVLNNKLYQQFLDEGMSFKFSLLD